MADDGGGTYSYGTTGIVEMYSPVVGPLDDADFDPKAGGTAALTILRAGGTTAGGVTTEASSPYTATSFSFTDSEVTRADVASGQLAADLHAELVDPAGESWTVDARFDETFTPSN